MVCLMLNFYLSGFSPNYAILVVARSIIGVSQAFFNPAAYTLLADIFPKTRIAKVNGIFTGAIYLGGGLASMSIALVCYKLLHYRYFLFIFAIHCLTTYV